MLQRFHFVQNLALILLILLVSGSLVFAEQKTSYPDIDQPKEDIYQSKQNHPAAIIKDGFYGGIENNRVTLVDTNTYRKSTYRLAPDYKILHGNHEIDWEQLGLIRIPPDSIVRLVLFDGQVHEIILLEVSS